MLHFSTFLKNLLIGFDGIAHDLLCFLQRTRQPTATCVEMAAAIEEPLCHFVAGELIHGAQAHPDEVVATVVLA